MERYAMFVHCKTVSKITILPKLTYQFNKIIMIRAGFGIKIDKMTLKYMWKCSDSKYNHNNHEVI